jgi:cytochrome P450
MYYFYLLYRYKHRKTSSHLFNLGKFKSGVQDTFNTNGDKLIRILRESKGKPIDIAGLMFKFTLDSIGNIAFGSDIGALDQDRVQFANDFDFCQESINLSFFDPLWRIKRLCTPDGWKYFMSLRRINAFAFDLVQKKRQAIKNLTKEEKEDNSISARNGRDLLSLYISREAEGDTPLTDSFLRDIVLNFVIAGRDTTAQGLSWAFYMACCNPDEAKIVQEEVDSVLKKYGTESGHVSYDALTEMKYLEAFCLETLRLYPSVPKEAKHVYNADTLPDGTKLKGGELVVFSPWIMGRDPNLWEDPLKFDPDRFFNKPKPSPFVFTAFQAGPRMCLGMNMALLEMKTVLARVMSNFNITLAQDKDSVTYRNSITLPILNGLQVTVQPRNAKA